MFRRLPNPGTSKGAGSYTLRTINLSRVIEENGTEDLHTCHLLPFTQRTAAVVFGTLAPPRRSSCPSPYAHSDVLQDAQGVLLAT